MLRRVLFALEAVERRVVWLLLHRSSRVHVHPFSGLGAGEQVQLGGRVLHGAPVRPGDVRVRSSRWAVLRANLLPFLSVEVPGAEVLVTLGARSEMVQADREGYVRSQMDGLPLPPGRHTVTLTPVRPAGAPAQGTVHVPDPTADLAVVSDIDDTIVDSGIAHGLLAILRTMLLQEQSTRVPLTGAPELYRALARSPAGAGDRPFFYLSTSPWNLVGFLQGFLQRHDFPDGPLILTDWGPGADGLMRVTTRTHKLVALRRLAQDLPHPRFLLIGDSGQLDPAIYAEFSREHPGRVAAIYIRRAPAAGPTADERTAAAVQLLDGTGVPLVLAADSDAMLQHAREHGLVATA